MYRFWKNALRKSSSIRYGVLAVSFLAAAGAANGSLVPLPGHIHRLAQARFDSGEAPNSLRMGGLDLMIAKTPQQEKALNQLLADQQNPKSPQYHRWLTPSEYGARFGATDAAIAALSNWLRSNGLTVGEVPAGRGHLPFSGSKAQVEAAFHTEIHLYNEYGEKHYANVSDPMIPAAVQPLVMAVRGLNDFYPKPGVTPLKAVPRSVLPTLAGHSPRTSASPDTYYSGTDQYPGYIGPTDFATIYNLLPAYQQAITGAGVTVAIAAQSDVNPSVLTTFWTAFGVEGSKFGLPAQQFTSILAGGTDPGQTGDGNEDEAYLDTEIIGALAPGAKIVLVRAESATTSAQYAIDQNLAAILNISFGSCEGDNTTADNSAINSTFQQAVTQGITITVSSADAGAAACTAESDIGMSNDVNTNGFAVNGIASTPYDLAVGGTDFNPSNESQYWNTTNQAGTLESAISHIPEMVWNDSCANPVFASAFAQLYSTDGVSDPIVFCNTTTLLQGAGPNPLIDISGSGGGISSCATSDASGNCTGGYPQPSWQQNVLGISNFGARAIPDVSMIATNWLMCSYDTNPCDPTQAPTFPPAATGTIKVLDGTSAAAPSVAAILALVDQTQITSALPDGRQGLVNPKLYALAGVEYGSSATVTACNASQGAIASSACIFYDVTAGSNAQPCSVANYTKNSQGTLPASTCGTESSSDKTGIMEISGLQDYVAGSGFDIASGLGSINAAGLIAAFQSSAAPTGLSASASGQTATLTWSADSAGTRGFNIYQGTASGQESSTPVQQNVMGTTATVASLQLGQTYYFEIAAVSALGASPVSNEAHVTILPAAPTGLAAAASSAAALNLTWTSSSGAATYNVFEGTTSGGESSSAAQSGITGTSTTVTGLTAGQKYFFTVVAVNAGGASAASTEASGTVLPATPTGLAATAGNATVSLSWSAAAGAASYNVYQGTSSGAENSRAVQTGLTSPSATVMSLSNGTTYYFTVAAVDAGGNSAQSSQASATPAAPAHGGGGSMDWLALSVLAVLWACAGRSAGAKPH
jgi:subtilase family serine protease